MKKEENEKGKGSAAWLLVTRRYVYFEYSDNTRNEELITMGLISQAMDNAALTLEEKGRIAQWVASRWGLQ